jgi:hypothetical protein
MSLPVATAGVIKCSPAAIILSNLAGCLHGNKRGPEKRQRFSAFAHHLVVLNDRSRGAVNLSCDPAR